MTTKSERETIATVRADLARDLWRKLLISSFDPQLFVCMGIVCIGLIWLAMLLPVLP